MDMFSALSVFNALGQPARLNALRLLIQAGRAGIPAGEIGEQLGIKQNTMSVNLKILVQAGLIISHRDGRIIRYAANYDTVQALVLFLMQDCCGGRTELCQPILDQVACGC